MTPTVSPTRPARRADAPASAAPPPATGLAPYTGPFGADEAGHLLRRTRFGVSLAEVRAAAQAGLSATLDALLTQTPTPAPPVNADEPDDPNVPIGQTWVEAPYVDGFDVNPYRSRSMQAWQLDSYLLADHATISPRMAFFWHNHFAVPRNGDARIYYTYLRTCWDSGLGNFRELVKAMTLEPQMLRFLNGNVNRADSPNENYARELLELFTIGKGPQVGSGDYTTYTEEDVRAISRALTGWRTRHFGSRDAAAQPESYFHASWHDPGDKQLSARLGGSVIADAGEDEYAAVVDLIFAQPLAAHYLCRKLYRYFVYHEIDAAVERDVIEPMAEALRAADFEVAPVLRLLLASEHFFELARAGALVRSPLEHLCDLVRGLGQEHPPLGTEPGQWLRRRWTWTLTDQGMRLWQPPSVAGWPAYYQAPQYHRDWINASTLQIRAKLALSLTGNGVTHDGVRYEPDLLALIASFDNPHDPNALIAEAVARFLPRPVDQAFTDALKDALIPGLPDFEWTVEYDEYLADPDDAAKRESVDRKVRDMLRALFGSAEIHLA